MYTCSQKADETIPQFVANLRQLSEGCNFKELNNMLRDRLVVGCRDTTTQRKLLSEATLTFEKALQMARAMEVANKDVENLKIIGRQPDGPTSTAVHKMQGKPPKPKTRKRHQH